MKFLKILTAAFLIAGCAQAANVDDDNTLIWECEFNFAYTSICKDQKQQCSSRTVDMSINILKNNQEFFLDTPGTTFPVREVKNIVHNSVSYVTDFERDNIHLVSIFSDGSASMSSHAYSGSAVFISYIGICHTPTP